MNAHQQARRRTWRSLFLLDSNKLTRIQNILTDRLTRNQVPPSFNCAVTLRNGTADTFQSIPDVLALDNTKRNPISSLTIIAQTPANAVSPASCTVEFTGGTKAKLSGTARDAISLSVDGQDPIANAETFAAIEEQVERALASPLPVVFVAVSLVVLLLIGMFTMAACALCRCPAMSVYIRLSCRSSIRKRKRQRPLMRSFRSFSSLSAARFIR